MNKYKHNYLDPWYQSLLALLVSEDQSFSKSDRTGTGTRSLFGVQFRHNMKDGFPLLTTKKMAWKTMVTELIWFLRGDTNIKFLVDNDCHIWDGDAYKNYLNYPLATIQDHRTNVLYKNIDKGWCVLNGRSIASPHPTRHLTKEEFINKIKTDDEFAKKWGELGPIYGAQWRNWDVPKILTIEKGKVENGIGTEWGSWERNPIDQIANLINELKTNPDSRRLMVSAWNVGELAQMVLPPCHYGFQMYTRGLSEEERIKILHEKYGDKGSHIVSGFDALDELDIPTRAISLMWNQRSVDTLLGLPFNIASYGLLLEIIAKEVNMVPDQLIGNLGDVHLYNNHIEQAKEQITRTPYELPTIKIEDEVVWTEHDCLPSYSIKDFTLENYQSHPAIKAPLSN